VQEEGLGKRDATSGNNNVLEPIQVSFVWLRLLLACACEGLWNQAP
jgi:hypothetical protein